MLTGRMFVKPMRSKSLVVFWLLILTISVKSIRSRSIGEHGKSRLVRSSSLVTDDALDYLAKFGYIPESDFETNNLRTDKQLENALRTLQTFGNIPITGKMDTATKELMQKPRCGFPDVNSPDGHRGKRHTLQGQKWDHVNLTWSLRTRNLKNLDFGWVRWELNRSLNVWSKHSKLTFREINSESADILIYFERGQHGDRFPFDGQGKVLAHAFSPGFGLGGDAHFDEDEEWLLNGKESVDGVSLFIVAAHEFGHSLGLSHSHVEDALMFPWYQTPKPSFELPNDDRIAIQILYGPKNKLWGDIPVYSTRPNLPNIIPRTSKTTTSTTTTTTTTTTTPRTTTRSFTTSRTIPTRRTDVSRYPSAENLPDFCQTSFDAVSVIRKEMFFFKGKYTWRLGKNGLYPEYPLLINRFWYNLPSDMTHVDAVYERQDGKVVFFVGRRYYVYNGNIPILGYPKPLTELGLPEELDHVDAATVWGHNSKTYIFSGNVYWKYDDETDRMELDYPRDMSVWRGVANNIDDAFQWLDGATYFLKNRHFWKFNDQRMRVEQEEPRSIGQFWFNCTPVASKNDGVNGRIQNEPFSGGTSSSARVAANQTSCPLFLSLAALAFATAVSCGGSLL